MVRFYLVRHGQTNWNVERRIQGQSESDLTDEGIRQAKALGKRLRDVDFECVYSSPLRRTADTTRYVLEGRDMPVVYSDNLKELLMGEWQGRLLDDLERDCPADLDIFWNHPEFHRLPGFETYREARERASALLEGLCRQYLSGNILVITHGALLKTLYTYFKYQSIHDIAHAPHPHSTGLSIVEKRDGVWNVLSWDDVSHLD